MWHLLEAHYKTTFLFYILGTLTPNPIEFQPLFSFSARLVGGSSAREGRVEVFHDGSWGTVCDDLWDMDDANVLCRSMGFGGAVAAIPGATYGEGTGDIFLDNVECTGREANIFDCPSSDIRQHNCGHHEDAGAECVSGKKFWRDVCYCCQTCT